MRQVRSRGSTGRLIILAPDKDVAAIYLSELDNRTHIHVGGKPRTGDRVLHLGRFCEGDRLLERWDRERAEPKRKRGKSKARA